MKKDISIIQNECQVVYNGMLTRVKPYILRPIGEYHYDRDENTDPAFCHFVYDEWSCETYAALNARLLKIEDVRWEDEPGYCVPDSVQLDTSKFHTIHRYDAYSLDEVDVPQHIGDLSYDELVELGSKVNFGSCYLAGYANDFFVERGEVSDVCDAFLQYLEEEYGKDADSHVTACEFADYVTLEY